MKAKIYSASVKGIFTQIKAFKKENALVRFKQLDPIITNKDISIISGIQNSHQVPVEEWKN